MVELFNSLGAFFQFPCFFCFLLEKEVPLYLLLLLLNRFSHVRLCATPQMAAHQAPPSLGFSRQEHWSGLPFPSPVHESDVAQSCPTLSDPMDCSPPGSSIHGIFQARVLEWGAIAFSDHYTYSHTKESTGPISTEAERVCNGEVFFHSS